MSKRQRGILHYKWSLDDGHVMPQILRVKSYKGFILAREPKKKWKKSRLKNHIYPLKDFLADPSKAIKKLHIKAIHIHHAILAPKLMFVKKKYKIPLIVGFRGKDATAYPKKKEKQTILKKAIQNCRFVFASLPSSQEKNYQTRMP